MALAAAVLQLAVMFLVPPIAWVVLTRRLNVSWRLVGLGCLTWLTALPFIIGVPMAAVAALGPQPLVWPVALSLTAGIVEETSRFLYYRRSAALRSPENWRGALVAGAGHGGVEAIVLGIQTAFGVAAFFFMRDWLPAEMQAIQPEPGYFLIGAGSRLLILVGHVGFTFLVWRAVSRAGEGRSEERGARGEERGARGEGRGARSEGRGARSEERGARSEERGARSDLQAALRPSPFAPRPSLLA